MGGLWSRRNWLTLAALGGFASVAFGAFAAHGTQDPRAQELLRTGSLYGFVHCLATFAAAGVMPLGGARARFAAPLFLAGVLLFSGSLYALALGAPRMVGVVTPIGGLCFLAGWIVLAWAARGVDCA
ncbi:DUF423 domain-containing protein [Phenylobacterium sp.]|jgi:uncharacterized membrane protein YgdD (TMEM256/DUF423 family)|uniref:DUF423 domain-containing protein n=1 Tax=Phenylobacterium sp. TaxID=1871053 RepID=UPI002F3F08EC